MEAWVRRMMGEFEARLRSRYGSRFRGAFLFGSHARGDADQESDVDVLIVLDRVTAYAEEIARTSEDVSDLSLEYGAPISRVFVSEDEWRAAPTLFFENVRKEAAPA